MYRIENTHSPTAAPRNISTEQADQVSCWARCSASRTTQIHSHCEIGWSPGWPACQKTSRDLEQITNNSCSAEPTRHKHFESCTPDNSHVPRTSTEQADQVSYTGAPRGPGCLPRAGFPRPLRESALKPSHALQQNGH